MLKFLAFQWKLFIQILVSVVWYTKKFIRILKSCSNLMKIAPQVFIEMVTIHIKQLLKRTNNNWDMVIFVWTFSHLKHNKLLHLKSNINQIKVYANTPQRYVITITNNNLCINIEIFTEISKMFSWQGTVPTLASGAAALKSRNLKSISCACACFFLLYFYIFLGYYSEFWVDFVFILFKMELWFIFKKKI